MSEKILISGLPGTGKNYIADHFVTACGFTHIDLEEDVDKEPQSLFYKDLPKFIAHVTNLDEPCVISVGFPPEMLPSIRRIADAGICTIWLDAPLLFSRTHWRPGAEQGLGTYDAQIRKIVEAFNDLRAFYAEREVNVATNDLQHRSVTDIGAQVLAIAQNG